MHNTSVGLEGALAWIKASGFGETTYGRTLRTRPWKWRGGKGNSLILVKGSLPLSVSVSTRSLPGPINKVLSSSSSAAAGKKWGTKVRGGRDPFLSLFLSGNRRVRGRKKFRRPLPTHGRVHKRFLFPRFIPSFIPSSLLNRILSAPEISRNGGFWLLLSIPPLKFRKEPSLPIMCFHFGLYSRNGRQPLLHSNFHPSPLPCIRENVNQRRGKCQLCAMRGRGGCKGSRGTGKGVVGS